MLFVATHKQHTFVHGTVMEFGAEKDPELDATHKQYTLLHETVMEFGAGVL